MSTAGCSSSSAPASEGCVENGAAALKTCAKGPTLSGVDVSSYQGTVTWSKVKAAGRTFAFMRISDGLNTPDSTFASNWSGSRAAGLVRGSYQYFRPGQDPALQAKMVVDKITAGGGLKPGDLPPVLDLETADGLASSTVVANAKIWLADVEKGLGIKPVVYTAAFMSSVIGTSFGGWTLWVANYGTTCPTMPSGWTDWQFWQNDDAGNVSGISGGVDTDVFNGTLADLQKQTFEPSSPTKPTPPPSNEVVSLAADDARAAAYVAAKPNDGSQGATLGSGTHDGNSTDGATITPCQ